MFFGEQHLHTSASPEAFVIRVRGTGDDAYNWAMASVITPDAMRPSQQPRRFKNEIDPKKTNLI